MYAAELMANQNRQPSNYINLRVAFLGLITASDRDGRFKWKPAELKLDCLPYDAVDFSEVLDILEKTGTPPMIRRYEAEGKEYGVVTGFKKHQRPKFDEAQSLLPRPPWEAEDDRPTTDGQSTQGREWKGREQEGNGTETDGSGYSPEFEEFWKAYPRKTAKGAAWKAWRKAKPTIELRAKILEAVAAQAKSDQWTKDGGQFIPHAATWLNQSRWDDEVKNTGRVGAVVKGGASPVEGKYAR